jgi:transcriptional regulator with XRE-family HTH domain
MTPPSNLDPFGPQVMFVTEMKARREAVNVSRNRLAEALGCSPQWLAKVETFEKPPSDGLADDLDTYWQASGTFRRIWDKYAEAKRQRLIPSNFRPLAKAEKDMTHISVYEPTMIPGLFQTEEHARLVFSVEHTDDKVSELLAIRMERQAVLAKPEPPCLFLLLREAVLRDLPPRIRVEQCKRLLDLMAHPKFVIQIIPASALVFQSVGFQVLGFAKNPDVAYVDGAGTHGQMLTDAQDVRALAILFNKIRADASSAEESEHLIRTSMECT